MQEDQASARAGKPIPSSPDRLEAPLEIEIHPLRTKEDCAAFKTLNEEWINRHFTLEQKDRETLDDPQTTILDRGGHIFMVYQATSAVREADAGSRANAVGCVALIPMGAGVYELSKMAISPTLRGRGIGRKLLEYAIVQARSLGARSLFLGSSTKLGNAVHLYESVGFRHVPPENLPPLHYTRADVFMEMPL